MSCAIRAGFARTTLSISCRRTCQTACNSCSCRRSVNVVALLTDLILLHVLGAVEYGGPMVHGSVDCIMDLKGARFMVESVTLVFCLGVSYTACFAAICGHARRVLRHGRLGGHSRRGPHARRQFLGPLARRQLVAEVLMRAGYFLRRLGASRDVLFLPPDMLDSVLLSLDFLFSSPGVSEYSGFADSLGHVILFLPPDMLLESCSGLLPQ